MMTSSHRVVHTSLQAYRSKALTIEAKLESYKCDRAVDVTYQWSFYRMTSSHLCKDVQFATNISIEDESVRHENGRVLILPPLFLLPGNYCVDVSVNPIFLLPEDL